MTAKIFLDALNGFQRDMGKISQTETILFGKKDTLKNRIGSAFSLKNSSINKDSPLAKGIVELDRAIHKSFAAWEASLDEARPMQALSDQYNDRIIFLVFGKVNAGKSSFANFLADYFPPKAVRRFRFKNGKIEYFSERFAEGITETTAAIQGAELGSNLVLLDSPGLHSVTDKNGALTRQFTDSTDAILWLTPSTSPGQVQELQDLREELAKRKPLLPIITRSDYLDDDYCERTKNIIQTLKNKTPENRKLQEHDVIERLKHFDGIQQAAIKSALSISVHAYSRSSKSDNDLQVSGLNILFERLVTLIDEAKAYKVGKANQQMINFLDKTVLASLSAQHEGGIMQQVTTLSREAGSVIDSLEKNKKIIGMNITTDVASEVSAIVHRHKSSRNKNAISTELNKLIADKIQHSVQQELAPLVDGIKQASVSLNAASLGDFEEKTVDIQQIKGSSAKSAAAAAGGIGGAMGGAALGNMFLPGIGGIVGGILGGLFGGAAGDAVGEVFIETETITESVGVSATGMIDSITRKLEAVIPDAVGKAFDDAMNTVKPVLAVCQELESIIIDFGKEVEAAKGSLK